MSEIQSFELAKGVNLRFFNTDKFKTNLISFYIHLPLCRETVTKAALLPRILKRGTQKYPTMTHLSKRAEELYGAALSAGISKKGDTELLRFSVQFVSDTFISEGITSEVVDLLKEFVLCPKVENGGFDSEYMRQEKENAKSFILGLVNDKKEYARVRCNEIMFCDDPYGIFEYGYVEDLDSINGEGLFEFYSSLISEAVVDIFAGGSFDVEMMKSELTKAFSCLGERDANRIKTRIASIENEIEIKNVTEEMPVTQSKLGMGFNCGVEPTSEEYPTLMLFSCIYGGSPFSKLFNNVRERLSLAYYVFSAVDRHKGCMKISSGIEADKFDEAYDEIMAQLDKMKNGEFSDEEIMSAKKYIATGMGSTRDNLHATEDFYMNQIILGSGDTMDSILEKVNRVSRDEIIRMANRVQLDTIYLLKGVGGNEI